MQIEGFFRVFCTCRERYIYHPGPRIILDKQVRFLHEPKVFFRRECCMPEYEDSKNNLIALGEGVGSKVERIKVESNNLRGHIQEELDQDTSHFSEDQTQLIKFHGMYQQEDRDARQSRKAAGAEKAYQFMIRSRIPGGALTADQYLVEDELADRYGNGSIRLTTRQSIQLHGVLKGNLRSVLYTINKALLSTLSACGD